jgi:carbonic anhydrase
MTSTNYLLLLFLLLGLVQACGEPPVQEEENLPLTEITEEEEPDDDILTKEEQKNLTPDEIMQLLKEGNKRFMNSDMTKRDHSEQLRIAVQGQYPKAVVLSCIDSRVPVEDVFDRGIGDMFVARVAGNFINTDILGSLEYSCKVAGSKLVVVLGHEHCGAVKAAIDNVKMGNITALLEKITPVLDHVEYKGERTSKNPEFVHEVCHHNVQKALEDIRAQSPILKEMEEKGDIKMVGAVYDMDTGKVEFL